MKDFKPCLRGLVGRVLHTGPGLWASVLILLVQVACSLLFVWASKRVVDIATGVSPAPFRPALWLMVGVVATELACSVGYNYLIGLVSVKYRNKLRAGVFSKALRSTWAGQEKFHSGDLVNRLEEDIRVINDFACTTVPQFIVTVVQFIAASAMFFSMSPQLTWILLLIMPVAVLGSRLFFRTMRRLSGEIREIDGRIQGHMQENLQHRVLIKTFGCEDAVDSGLVELQGKEQSKTRTKLAYGAVSRAFIQLGFSGGYLLAFFWGASGIKDGTVTYGLMVAFLQLVSRVQRPVASIAAMVPTLIHALTSEERIQEVTGLDQEARSEDIPFEGAPGVKLERICYSYPDRKSSKVIRDLSYDFKPGSFTAITGPTGAGKSTVTRMILSLLTPDSGTVSLYDDSGRTAKACVGTRCNFMYVPQGNSLLSGTIRQNLLLADPDATEDEMLEVLHVADADFVGSLSDGLDTRCSEVGAGLSEGQAQRIAIARALLRKGGVLILDEATSSLDAGTERTVLGRIVGAYRGSKTIICITHRPAATELADGTLDIH